MVARGGVQRGVRVVVRVVWCALRSARQRGMRRGVRAHEMRRGVRAHEMRRGVRAHEMRRGCVPMSPSVKIIREATNRLEIRKGQPP